MQKFMKVISDKKKKKETGKSGKNKRLKAIKNTFEMANS